MKRVLVLIPVAALCAWGIMAWAVRPLACNDEVNEMRARTAQARATVNDYRLALLVRDNLARLRRLETQCRMQPYVYTLQAENQYLLGRKEESIETIRRALAIDQRPELYAAIGDTLFELGRVPEAIDNYVIAARFNALIVDEIDSDEIKREVRLRLKRPKS